MRGELNGIIVGAKTKGPKVAIPSVIAASWVILSRNSTILPSD